MVAQLDSFRGVTYHCSYTTSTSLPDDLGKVIAFVGRSNSGKSSLISALCDHSNLARTSQRAGKTQTINYYIVPEREPFHPQFCLADLPGFGFARLPAKERATLREMVDQYLLNAPALALMVVVLDAKRSPGDEERNILDYSKEIGLPIIFARSRWDTLNAKERKERRAAWKKDGIDLQSLPISSTKKIGLNELREKITSLL